MALKFEIIGNALVVTDTDTNEIVGEAPKRTVYYNAQRLNKNDVIEIVNVNPQSEVNRHWKSVPITNAIDGADAAFTKGSFQTFARTNLGN